MTRWFCRFTAWSTPHPTPGHLVRLTPSMEAAMRRHGGRYAHEDDEVCRLVVVA